MKISKFRAQEALQRLEKVIDEELWSISFELENEYNIKKPHEEEINNREHPVYLLGYFEAYTRMRGQLKNKLKEVVNE